MALLAYERARHNHSVLVIKRKSSPGDEQQACQLAVTDDETGKRLDLLVADHDAGEGMTRSRIQQLISSGHIRVNGLVKKSGYRVQKGDEISIHLPPPRPSTLAAEEIFFEIIHEDNDILVISKPPGLVVHPAQGHGDGTLVHGLLYHCQDLSGIGGELRPGIVHRLDKDTSGIMIVAKNDFSHHRLVDAFKRREMEKIYHALLAGVPPSREGRLVTAIGRHPVNRKKMAVLPEGGREAVTIWEVLGDYNQYSYVRVRLETGRTHQIRVHMAHLGCPVAGDPLYGRKRLPWDIVISRQCLHSSTLTLNHPRTGERLTFSAPLWPDMVEVLEKIRVLAKADG